MRRTSELWQRRRAEAEDVIQMMLILDVNKVVLPKFAITDPDRVPTVVWSVSSNGSSV